LGKPPGVALHATEQLPTFEDDLGQNVVDVGREGLDRRWFRFILRALVEILDRFERKRTIDGLLAAADRDLENTSDSVRWVMLFVKMSISPQPGVPLPDPASMSR